MNGQVQLDAETVSRRVELKYGAMIQQLVRENAQLEAYVAELLKAANQTEPSKEEGVMP